MKDNTNMDKEPAIGLKQTYRSLAAIPTSEIVKAVVLTCCKEYEITPAQFHYEDKYRTGTKPQGASATVASTRHMYCYLMKTYLKPGFTLRKIGSYIYQGFKHSSVIYGIKRVQDSLDVNMITPKYIEHLLDLVDIQISKQCSLESQDTQEAARILRVNSSDILSPESVTESTPTSNSAQE